RLVRGGAGPHHAAAGGGHPHVVARTEVRPVVVGPELLPVEGRVHDAVDVPRREARIGERALDRLRGDLLGGAARGLGVVRLPDAGDRDLAGDVLQVGGEAPVGRCGGHATHGLPQPRALGTDPVVDNAEGSEPMLAPSWTAFTTWAGCTGSAACPSRRTSPSSTRRGRAGCSGWSSRWWGRDGATSMPSATRSSALSRPPTSASDTTGGGSARSRPFSSRRSCSNRGS